MSSAFPRVRLGAFRPLPISIQAVLLAYVSACTDGDAVPLDATTTDASPVEMGDAGDESDADAEGPEVDLDAESGVEDPPDAEDGSDDADTRCLDDEDCDDGLLCNGKERCVESSCVPGTPAACTREHPCREETQGCDCRDPDSDKDTVPAEICVGEDGDCDDGNILIHPGQAERCDLDNVDEDCDPTTYAGTSSEGRLDGDRDHDGWVSETCMNFDRVLKKEHRGPDCDDTRNDVHPENSEVCNYIDDNCNKAIDELPIKGTDRYIELGLRPMLYPDFDQDGYVDMNATPKRECDFRIPPGYAFATADDCDDRPILGVRSHPGAPEVCDKLDNDCDGAADDPEDLIFSAEHPDTELACVDGKETIARCPATKLWCEGDPIDQGCRTDGTRLHNCGACGRTCQFSCAGDGCDEITLLAAGFQHACALTRTGEVACWGRGGDGRLGVGSTSDAVLPTKVAATLPPALAIASGPETSCAIARERRALYCWGSDSKGQLGSVAVADGTFTATYVPVGTGSTAPGNPSPPRYLEGVSNVSLGPEHSCAVLSSGRLACWGEQEHGRLGNNLVASAVVSLPALARNANRSLVTNANFVSLGTQHGCIITRAGGVECWGNNANGQLGRDPAVTPSSPLLLPVEGLSSVTALAAGDVYTCAVSAGQVYCWGANERTRLGRVTAATTDWVPAPVQGVSGVAQLAVGSGHACATTDGGELWCWGANDRGQLDATLVDGLPRAVSSSGVRALALGGTFSCALAAQDRAFCWGDDAYGQQGNGLSDANPQPAATPISALRGSLP